MMSCKRITDLTLAVFALIVLFPFLLLIALFVYLDSPGQVIFSQQRLGKNGNLFKMHKFRKFPADWGCKGPGVTTRGDVRMTRVGRVIERTKLDELPQLWNILKGEMSFVGPRPESVRYSDLFTGEYKKVLNYIPGVFGPNQVAYRNESAMYPANIDPDEFYRTQLFAKKAQSDIKYFEQADCLSDLRWIFKGILISIAGVVDWKRSLSNHLFIVVVDLLLFQIAWLFANWLRFGLNLSDANCAVYITGTWLLPLILLPIMLVGGCYRHPVRYFSLSDAIRLFVVVSGAWLTGVLVEIGFFHRNMSIGVALLGLILLMVLLTLPRVWRRERWVMQYKSVNKGVRSILIYGANVKGNALARFLSQAYPEIHIAGFIDEDEDQLGQFLNGYKVLGSWRDRDVIVDRFPVSELWVSDSVADYNDTIIEKWGKENNIKTVFLNQIQAFSNTDYI